MAMEWDRESKKEEDSLHEDLNVQLSLVEEESDAFNFKHKIEENAEDIQTPESGEEKDCQDRTNGREKSGENRDESLKVEEVDSALDSLKVVEEILLKFYDFIDHIFPMLKDGQREEFQELDRIHLLRRVGGLLQTLTQRINTVADEIEHKKNDENQEDIPRIFNQLLVIHERLRRSFKLGISSLLREKCTENELSSCVDELNQSKEELRVIILRITELKTKEMGRKCRGESSNWK